MVTTAPASTKRRCQRPSVALGKQTTRAIGVDEALHRPPRSTRCVARRDCCGGRVSGHYLQRLSRGRRQGAGYWWQECLTGRRYLRCLNELPAVIDWPKLCETWLGETSLFPSCSLSVGELLCIEPQLRGSDVSGGPVLGRTARLEPQPCHKDKSHRVSIISALLAQRTTGHQSAPIGCHHITAVSNSSIFNSILTMIWDNLLLTFLGPCKLSFLIKTAEAYWISTSIWRWTPVKAVVMSRKCSVGDLDCSSLSLWSLLILLLLHLCRPSSSELL